MAKGLLLAWSSPVSDEREAEFNSWYDDTHIPQVRTAIASITAVHRFRTAYAMDSADVAAAMAALGQAGAEGRLDPTDTMDVTDNPPVLQWYQAAQ
jgi:hypothetical protein